MSALCVRLSWWRIIVWKLSFEFLSGASTEHLRELVMSRHASPFYQTAAWQDANQNQKLTAICHAPPIHELNPVALMSEKIGACFQCTDAYSLCAVLVVQT